jgi:potassium-transporting ATPase KdpC subunit
MIMEQDMRNLKPCIVIYIFLTVITGILYPLFITLIAKGLFHDESNGSLYDESGTVRGSFLIGQQFTDPAYFLSRPSASEYATVPSGASNLGPTSDNLKLEVESRRRQLALYISEPIPADLLLASGSGLDPHISPEAALAQITHVAQARNLSPDQIESLNELVRQYIEPAQWGFLGAPRVNVLMLNIAVDSLFGKPNEGANQR